MDGLFCFLGIRVQIFTILFGPQNDKVKRETSTVALNSIWYWLLLILHAYLLLIELGTLRKVD